MTLSLCSVYRAWQRDRTLEKQYAGAQGDPLGMYSALAMLGNGLGGVYPEAFDRHTA